MLAISSCVQHGHSGDFTHGMGGSVGVRSALYWSSHFCLGGLHRLDIAFAPALDAGQRISFLQYFSHSGRSPCVTPGASRTSQTVPLRSWASAWPGERARSSAEMIAARIEDLLTEYDGTGDLGPDDVNDEFSPRGLSTISVWGLTDVSTR